ncbi:unnamed protein product [Microthlaspi erraticum]|uniref:RNase H type-1 domain-containing protein n=1 Tax=Microthlaspi erraticum TaxID=1685480 RepID=A0A6D2HU20_9BRAS|nr:unnamed protein product [Microthlaspi erraticum]
MPAINWNQQVWNVKTSPKMQMFIWRSLHGALPVGEQLEIRNIVTTTTCCRCNEPESILHLLFHCNFAQKVWKLAPFPQDFISTLITSLNEGLNAVRNQVTLPPVGLDRGKLYPWILWAIWTSRNQKIFENRIFTVEETILKATCDAREWNLAQIPVIGKTRFLSGVNRANHGVGTIVCCTDAAWMMFGASGSAGLGWIFTADEGQVSSYSSAHSFVSSALVAEALAIREALFKAVELGFTSLILQFDSLILIKAINSRSPLLETHGILADIVLIEKSFISLKFNFIPRLDNTVADSVAKQALWAFQSLLG